MNLIITLSNPDILPESLRTRRVEFGSSGGLIGRHQDCDWVLDDPERFVSSKHLRILSKGDGFFAEDISTNGTYLNEDLIGKGNKAPLLTGDVLRLGRYILAVEQRDESGSVIDETGGTDAAVDLLADTSHGKNSDGLGLGGKTDDLLAASGETEEIDDFIGDSFVEAPEDDLVSTGFAPLPGVQDALPAMHQEELSEAVPSDWMTRKPEDTSSKPQPASDDLLSGGGINEPTGEMDDYGLTPVPPPAGSDLKSSEEDVTTPDNEAKKKPQPKPATKKAATVKKSPKKKPTEKKATPKKPKVKTTTKKPSVKKAAATTAAVAAASAAGAASHKSKKTSPKKVTEPTPEPFQPEAEPARQPSVTEKPVYSEPASEDFGTSLASALLLKPEQAIGETGHVLGLVLRELLEGSLDLLSSRTQMRQELRMSATTVGARENNPLKFSINYQDALGRMLQGESMGFKPPVESTVEIIDDLKRHQLGVLAGIDAGVKALLDALDPKKIGSGKTVIAGLSMTSKMSAHHAKITEDTVERTDGVFWRAFAEAYKLAVTTSNTS